MVTLRPDVVAARLHDLGIASPEELSDAKADLASSEERFSAILTRRGVIRDAEAGRRLVAQLGTAPQRLTLDASSLAVESPVSAELWRTHRLVPFRLPSEDSEGQLFVATDDPLSVFTLEFFGRRCGQALEAVLVRKDDLEAWWRGLEQQAAAPTPPEAGHTVMRSPQLVQPGTLQPAAGEPLDAARPAGNESVVRAASAASEARKATRVSDVSGAPQPAAAAASATDEPIVQLADSILREAVRMRASDIHIQPSRERLRVRYRIDGVLRDVTSPPPALLGPLVSRIKIMASLNIAEKRLPQDGRMQLEVDRRALDLRVSTLPALHGESIVMRLLDRSQPVRGLKELGLSSDVQATWEALVRRPHGMVLVTGPTGSGKTTTLYGALAMLNQAERKLITVEDPVEYQLAGVNQVAAKPMIGLTFAAALRSMLRQAPDVIMVGEIRDHETAQMAVQAALTGHLVLSTLHTNDAPSAVTRLIDMGIAPFLVASTLQGVLAQRLVRRICDACRLTDHATAEERAFLGEPPVAQVIRGNGCDRCHDTGFQGRVGLFELLEVSDSLRELVVARANLTTIRERAMQEGMRGLRDDGCAKVREGLTTITEVLRVVEAT